MSSMIDPMHHDQMTHSSPSPFSMTVPTFRIKRPGARPLVFEGVELAMAMSFTPSLSYWYETNLYRTNDQRFVACVRLFFQSADEQDQIRGWDFDTLDQALDKLAHYDAGQDIRVQSDPSDPHMPPAELAALAMDLRAKIASARRHYQSLVGEFFYELETVKAPVARSRS